MHYRIDKHAERNILLLAYAQDRTALVEMSLRQKSLKLLYEEIETKGVVNAIQDLESMVAKFASLFPQNTAGPMIAEIKKFISKLPDESTVNQKMLTASDEELQQLSKSVSTKTDNAVRAMASVHNAIQRIIQGLLPYAQKNPNILDVKISELFTDPELKGELPTKEKFESGVKNAFVPSQAFNSALAKGVKAAQTSTEAGGQTELGQLFSTAAKFFVGMSQKKKSVDSFPDLFRAFLQYLNSSTIKELQEVSTKLRTQGNNLVIGSAQNAGKVTATVAAVASGADVDGRETSEEDDEPAGEEEDDDEPADDKDDEPGEGEVKVDDVIYKKSKKSGNWYERDSKNPASSAKKVMQDKKLLAKIEKAANKGKKKSAVKKPSVGDKKTVKTKGSKSTVKTKDDKKTVKTKDDKSVVKTKGKKKTGTKAESFNYNHNEILVERWQRLAGIL
jgi:hypothetical protein